MIRPQATHLNIVASNLATNLVKLLDRKRVDAIAYGYDVAVWYMLKEGIDPSQFEIAYRLLGGELGYAFYKGTDSKLLEQYQVALDELRAEGKLERIRRSYLDSSANTAE